MGLDELLAVVDGAEVALDDRVLVRIADSRAVVERTLTTGADVYGMTTQVGHGKDTRLTAEQIRHQQLALVTSHGGGIGEPLPTEIVRAAMAVRLNGIARGWSGAAPAVADTLVAMLNARVTPLVPRTGSVGAGDLGQMAMIAQVAVGLGRADCAGETLSGAEALRRAGIAALQLGGRDGLALIATNGVSIGQAALVVARAEAIAGAADVAAALSMEATRANPSVLHPAVGRAKPIPGQVAAADHLRELLDGGDLLRTGAARSVQDALSFRVVPQVHGALREYVAGTRRAVLTELNAGSDNPLTDSSEQTMISNGTFHPMVLAISCDALRVALAHVGELSERRMDQLWKGFFGRPTGWPSPPSYGMQVRYPAAAVLSELKQQAAPATLDTPPLDLGIEDHATGAPLSVRRTDAALGLLEDLLAAELMLAHDLLAGAPELPRLGVGTAVAQDLVEDAIAAAEDRPDAEHRAVRERLRIPYSN